MLAVRRLARAVTAVDRATTIRCTPLRRSPLALPSSLLSCRCLATAATRSSPPPRAASTRPPHGNQRHLNAHDQLRSDLDAVFDLRQRIDPLLRQRGGEKKKAAATESPIWKSTRTTAEELLTRIDRVLSAAGENVAPLRLSASDWDGLFRCLRNWQLWSRAPPLWRLMQAQMTREWSGMSEQTVTPADVLRVSADEAKMIIDALVSDPSDPARSIEAGRDALDWMQRSPQSAAFQLDASSFSPLLRVMAMHVASDADLAALRRLFAALPSKSVLTYTTIIGACARVGDMAAANALFEEMQWSADAQPDSVAVEKLLSVCAAAAAKAPAGSAARQAAVDRADQLWSLAVHRADRLLHARVTSAMIDVYEAAEVDLRKRVALLTAAQRTDRTSAALARPATGQVHAEANRRRMPSCLPFADIRRVLKAIEASQHKAQFEEAYQRWKERLPENQAGQQPTQIAQPTMRPATRPHPPRR